MSMPLVQMEAGDYCILVDALAVHEIIQPEPSDFSSEGCQMAWRDEILPVMDARLLLGGDEKLASSPWSSTVLVYTSMPGQRLALVFDRVMGIRSVTETGAGLSPLPQSLLLPEAVYQIFDGVISDLTDAARQMYHLRRPFDLLRFNRSMTTRP